MTTATPSRTATVRAVARVGLRRLLTSPVYVGSVLILPWVVIVMVSVVVGTASPALDVGLVVEGESPLASAMVDAVRDVSTLDVHDYGDREALRRAVRADEVVVGLVVPAGVDEALRAGRPVQFSASSNPTRPAAAAAGSAIAAALSQEAAAVQAAVFAGRWVGADFDVGLATARRLSEREVRSVIVGAVPERRPYDYGVAGTVAMFMFITAMGGALFAVSDRRRGITRRLHIAPVWPGALLAGEMANRFVVVFGQGMVVVVGSALALDVTWGPPAAVVLVVGAFAAVCAVAAVGVGALARTVEQALLFGTAGGVGLGLLGGAFWPREVVGPVLGFLARLTPHAYAIDGLLAVQGGNWSFEPAARAVAILFLVALAGLPLAVRRARRVALS
ncbi:MAG: ABC transporter permease [Actinobacteria bacterium]|nr:ABC transporter permease [Actinomycetota bacterium]